MKILYLLFGLTAFFVYLANGQQTSDLNAILDSVQPNHPALKMYDAEVRAMDEGEMEYSHRTS